VNRETNFNQVFEPETCFDNYES